MPSATAKSLYIGAELLTNDCELAVNSSFAVNGRDAADIVFGSAVAVNFLEQVTAITVDLDLTISRDDRFVRLNYTITVNLIWSLFLD